MVCLVHACTCAYGVCQALLPSWNHDSDPTERLLIGDNVQRFRKLLQDDPKFLNRKVQQYFLVSSRCCALTKAFKP